MKLLLLPVLLAFACILGGAYGALHNQISYTVAPEYFHDFKFIQFGISIDFHTRWGAAQVGILASWWMGLVIGIPIFFALLRVKGISAFVHAYVQLAVIIVVVTLIIGIVGLLISTYVIDPDLLVEISPKRETADPVAFARAGAMHDFSYLGGIVGLCVGLFIAVRKGRR